MVGHDLTREEIMERANKAWDLSGPLPLFLWPVQCPVCRSLDVMAKAANFFQRKPEDYRCDVVMKCTVCSAVWIHGVVVPEEMAKPRIRAGGWTWREMREEIINARI